MRFFTFFKPSKTLETPSPNRVSDFATFSKIIYSEKTLHLTKQLTLEMGVSNNVKKKPFREKFAIFTKKLTFRVKGSPWRGLEARQT